MFSEIITNKDNHCFEECLQNQCMRVQGDEYRVVIIGGDHYNTYGVVRSLGEEGIKTDVIIIGCRKRRSFVLRSRYVLNGYCFFDHQGIVKCLLSNYSCDTTNIVICCSDAAEELVLEHYEQLSEKFVLPVCQDYQDTIQLMNKKTISDLAVKFGIRVPRTWLVINRLLPNGIVYPCITKPLSSTKGHKSDIVKCTNEEELLQIISDENRCTDFVVQEYIEYENEVSVLGVALANGKVCLSGCINKLRTCMIGTTSFGVMVDNSLLGDNITKLETMMKSIRFQGLFSAEFLFKDGIFYFLEVNFRNDGNTYVATASGNNLPMRYVKSLVGCDIHDSHKCVYPCFFMLDMEDFFAIKRNHISVRQWYNDFRRANICLVFNKLDKKPFNRKLKSVFAEAIKRAYRRCALTCNR